MANHPILHPVCRLCRLATNQPIKEMKNITKIKITEQCESWECGDHCCSGTHTNVWINSKQVMENEDFFNVCEKTAQMICDHLGLEFEMEEED